MNGVKESFAMKKLLLVVPFVAACTQANIPQEQTAAALAPTAGVYQNFKAKGGGQVLADTFVAPPEDAGGISTVVASATSRGSCWDGSSGGRLGSILFCPPKPPNIVVTTNDDGTIVVSSAGGGSTDDDDDDDTPTPTIQNPPTSGPTGNPVDGPTGDPTDAPTGDPKDDPTGDPTGTPTDNPTGDPTGTPTGNPTETPTDDPTGEPTGDPTGDPTGNPTAGFQSKYDKIEEVYGTRDIDDLSQDDYDDVKEYYDENGGDSDWSGYEADAE
jgi:hypothetical protein